jgi:hypothetical protein
MNPPLKRRACPSSLDRLGDDRPHDGGPATYVKRSVGIGVGDVSTPLTDELALRSPVGLLAMPALRTRLRSVGRIDRYQHDPGKPGLVFQEAAKLPESPLGVPTTLRPFQPFADAESDAFEVFEGCPRSDCFALLTICLLRTWFVTFLNRRSLPESFFRWRFADLVPAF